MSKYYIWNNIILRKILIIVNFCFEIFCFPLITVIDAHGLKIQGEGQGGFCQILGGRVYRGCENFGGRVPLFGVLLHFY